MTKLLGILVLGFLLACSDDSSTNNKISLGSKVYSNDTSCGTFIQKLKEDLWSKSDRSNVPKT